MKTHLGILFAVGVSMVGFTTLHLSHYKSNITKSDLTLNNIEALANGEGIDGIVLKNCYTLFSTEVDGEYHATCSVNSDMDIIYECGAVTYYKPVWGVT